MSTNAIIFFKKENDKYDGVVVYGDGYIRIRQRPQYSIRTFYIEGLGYTLNNYWDMCEDVKKLCSGPTQIRLIDGNCIEYYDHKVDKSLKDLTEDEMMEIRHGYCYSYVYEWSDERKDYVWYAGRTGYDTMYDLQCFFNGAGYENDEDWWETHGDPRDTPEK